MYPTWIPLHVFFNELPLVPFFQATMSHKVDPGQISMAILAWVPRERKMRGLFPRERKMEVKLACDLLKMVPHYGSSLLGWETEHFSGTNILCSIQPAKFRLHLCFVAVSVPFFPTVPLSVSLSVTPFFCYTTRFQGMGSGLVCIFSVSVQITKVSGSL
jgi:hypothetical protein